MNELKINLEERYKSLSNNLGLNLTLLTMSPQDGAAHIEFHQANYHYVKAERGIEFERRVTNSEDEALYWLFSDVVFYLAMNFELENRIKGQDFRRILFAKELELMNLLNPAWKIRKEIELQTILSQSPYDS